MGNHSVQSFTEKLKILLLFFTFFNCFNFSAAQLTTNLIPPPSSLLSTLTNNIPDAQSSNNNLVFRQREVLNATTSTILDWEIVSPTGPNSTIIFNYTTSVSNRLGSNATLIFGLSRTGNVEGADVVAVTLESATSGLVDMHGVDNNTLVPDAEQSWNLLSFQQNSTHVSASFSRLVDTCDDQDVVINNDLLHIIWGYGDATTFPKDGQFTNFHIEGSLPAYLLDPVVIPPQDDLVESWRLSRTLLVPARHTSYWCTLHKAPQLSQKHHIVGFAPHLPNEDAVRHVHHQVVHRCYAPHGIDPALLFEKYMGHPGEECYLEETHQLPLSFCTEVVHVWGIGGKSFDFPSDVGLSFGETQNEYFLFEVHYDNPESRADLMLENGVDFRYSPQLREHEGGWMYFGIGLHGLHLTPPGVARFTQAGHCSSECTKEMIPASGVDIKAVMLHSHLAGRELTAHHYRGNQELPWIQSDRNYDINFQQMRLLPKPRTILPGDHLTAKCVLDTSSRNGTTVSGFSTMDEMCITWVLLTKRLPYFYCSSEYPTERTMERYGVTNMTWSRERQERMVNSANNSNFVGLSLSQVVDQSEGIWTPEMVENLEREQLYDQHESTCPPLQYVMLFGHTLATADVVSGGLLPGNEVVDSFTPNTNTIRTSLLPGLRATSYPGNATEYAPPQPCT